MLDGTWDCALELELSAEHPDAVDWDRRLEVPFAPETERSGIHHEDYLAACWYRRQVPAPAIEAEQRLILHFGAVDYCATVWIDGGLVGSHEGGYTPFQFDVTRELSGPGEHELVVRAEDDPWDLAKPRGKQDWERSPHSIWYPRTTGIWQSVWIERVHRLHLDTLVWRSRLDRLEVVGEFHLATPAVDDVELRVVLGVGDRRLVDDRIWVAPGSSRVVRAFRLDASGVDHLRESLFWSPDNPALIDATVELRTGDDAIVDAVKSYTALREIGLADGRFMLNGRPYPLRMVLDQGYWDESGLTPPSHEALRRDVELTKAMGFNGVRKHQKIEDPRYLEWADRLGLLVWVEMPPAYQFDSRAVRRVTDEWAEVVERDRSHPCIVTWVPFNESTGLLNLPTRDQHRHFVRALTELTKTIDPSRPVVSNDGWESVGGDIIGVHDYEQDPERLLAQWSGDLRHAITGFAAHGRRQTLDEDAATWTGDRPSRPIVLTEVGGIGWSPSAPLDRHEDPPEDRPDDRLAQPASWGYSTVATADELAERYEALMGVLHQLSPTIAGFCYTQLADTYQEVNGLLFTDRTPKVPLERIAAATRGPKAGFFDPLA